MKKYFSKSKDGFVALFTVLIASVILAMALGIATIALKEIVLTASATDANKSFYAADTGVECALFHDIKQGSFIPGITTLTIQCGGGNILVGESYFGFFQEFQVPVGADDEFCAYVIVDKTSPTITRITSRGLNAPCNTTGPRVVERAIEVTY